MEKVNELCKELRTNANLSVVDLSRLMDYDVTSIRKIESGELGLSLDIASKYADLFGKQYFDELAYPLLRYDCAPLINDLLKERHISQNRFIRAFKLTNSAFLTNKRNGKPYKGYKPEEIKVLANYFNVDQSVFYNCKQYYVTKCSGRGNDSIIGSNVKIIPDPRPKEVKKTAQMICEEEKKMEYEEALKKAKDFDILKEENDHLKKDCDEWSMMYNAARGRIDELEADYKKCRKDFDELNDEIKKYKGIEKERDKAVEAYDNLSQLYGSLSKEAKEKDALINELSRINQDLKKKVDSVDYALASDYKTVSAELAKYKDILLEILLEQRKAK